ncbi:MAG TPA: 50S ribosomal protein L29 [Thermomicrobiaceae bacterium]|nr:50S ribosomal protein L29 [Thermomicrobiaceae bacterium]
MKASEVRAMTDRELIAAIDNLKTEWRDLRFDEAIGKLNNPMRIRAIKRDIARIKTIQTERQIASELERHLEGQAS